MPQEIVVFASKFRGERVDNRRDGFRIGGAQGVVLGEDSLVLSAQAQNPPTERAGRWLFG